MQEEVVKKYVRDLEGLKSEVESFKRRFPVPEKGEWELPLYHEAVIFLFSIIYKYLVFENIPVFSGHKGLDAWIEHEGKVIDVEFEVLSSNLLQPKHHTDRVIEECQLLVCWRDNSRKKQDCWKHIDVFELKYLWE